MVGGGRWCGVVGGWVVGGGWWVVGDGWWCVLESVDWSWWWVLILGAGGVGW